MMYYLFRFTDLPENNMLRQVKQLVGEKAKIKDILFPQASMMVEAVATGKREYSEPETLSYDFSHIFEALLPSEKNVKLKSQISSDVIKLLAEGKEENPGIFNGSKKDTVDSLLIFDIEELTHLPQVTKQLMSSLKTRPSPVLFLHPASAGFANIVLKYTGKENSVYSIYSFTRVFAEKALNAKNSILISPFNFRKSQLAQERRFVKKASEIYGFLGFIKLPFSNVDDFVQYAIKNDGDIIVLPKNDVQELPRIFKNDSLFNEAAGKGVSIFIG